MSTTDHAAAAMTARSTAAAAKDQIGTLGGEWMVGEAEEQATVDAGLQGWQLYFIARHGVLGDVDPDVIAAAAYFFPPAVVRTQWQAARAVLSPGEAVQRYLSLCTTWAEQRLGDFAGAGRLADLASAVADAASVIGRPLFAGWRAVPRPVDDPQRCTFALHLLREHRGATHGLAVVAAGLDPLTAILADSGGEENAIDYGWSPPFAVVTDLDRERRRHAEELTDALVTPAFEVLSATERAEFLILLDQAYEHVFRDRPPAGTGVSPIVSGDA